MVPALRTHAPLGTGEVLLRVLGVVLLLVGGCADRVLVNDPGVDGGGGTDAPTSSTHDAPTDRGHLDAGPPDAAPRDTGSDGVPNDVPSACAAEVVAGRHVPLNLYLMLDQSAAMNDAVADGTKWSAVGAGLNAFLQQPPADVALGLQFFPLASNGADSCTAGDYASPAVPMQALPGADGAIRSVWLTHSPGGGVPTSAALQGAVDYARSYAGSHRSDVTAVVLVTNSYANECDPSFADLDAIAAAGVGGAPSVATYVVAIGSSLTSLSGVATAGGTTQGYMLDTNGNVHQQMQVALEAIRTAAVGCAYAMPWQDGGTPDPTRVNVEYTPGSGTTPQVLPAVPDQAHCPASGDAWYFDDPNAPTRIALCPTTCARIAADAAGEVDLLLGCLTLTP
jgi:hypothetical protein